MLKANEDVGKDLGIGTTKLDFQSSGTKPEEIEVENMAEGRGNK